MPSASQGEGRSWPSRARAGGGEPAWYRGSFALSAASGILLWAALPPLGLWPLGWIAPIFWLVLIQGERLPGRRPYRAIWAAGALFWLAAMQGIRLPHWALYFGWAALSAYLGLYLVLFVGLTRVAVHRGKAPLMLAAPVVWTGLELARGHMLTGFSMALLAHTQTGCTMLIQIADLFGAYGVSFVLMLTAACLVQAAPWGGWAGRRRPTRAAAPVLAGACVVGLTFFYGWRSLRRTRSPQPNRPTLHAALIQESVDTILGAGPERALQTLLKYRRLTLEACAKYPDLDLIVWPESMFTANYGELLVSGSIQPPPGMNVAPERFRQWAETAAAEFRAKSRLLAESFNAGRHGPGDSGVRLLVGTETDQFAPEGARRYNSALLLDPAGRVIGRYYKMHPVMFGEYIPGARFFPWIDRISPIGRGLTAGGEPQAFEAAGVTISPSICFESTVPHLIRRQVVELCRRGQSPDVLVNITNDGWFRGSSILDLHFDCAVFRAVETRRPVLIAANTGFSGWIDSNGAVIRKGPRRAPCIVRVDLEPESRSCAYLVYGDLPAGICLAACVLLAAWGGWGRWRAKRKRAGRAASGGGPPAALSRARRVERGLGRASGG